jgi:hypothetical protein
MSVSGTEPRILSPSELAQVSGGLLTNIAVSAVSAVSMVAEIDGWCGTPWRPGPIPHVGAVAGLAGRT